MTASKAVTVSTAATAAIFAFAAPVQAAPARLTFQVLDQPNPRVRFLSDAYMGNLAISVPTKGYMPIADEGDFGVLTDADMAMLQHAMTAGAAETDFSEFYIDDDE